MSGRSQHGRVKHTDAGHLFKGGKRDHSHHDNDGPPRRRAARPWPILPAHEGRSVALTRHAGTLGEALEAVPRQPYTPERVGASVVGSVEIRTAGHEQPVGLG
jgi:hypothetical protein